jgi:hypothetical protein
LVQEEVVGPVQTMVLVEVTQYFRPLHQLVVVLVQDKERLVVVLVVAEAGLDGQMVLAALERQTKDLLVQLVLAQQTPAVLVVAQAQLVITVVQAVLERQTQ